MRAILFLLAIVIAAGFIGIIIPVAAAFIALVGGAFLALIGVV